jgi:hypothetical protein
MLELQKPCVSFYKKQSKMVLEVFRARVLLQRICPVI